MGIQPNTHTMLSTCIYLKCFRKKGITTYVTRTRNIKALVRPTCNSAPGYCAKYGLHVCCPGVRRFFFLNIMKDKVCECNSLICIMYFAMTLIINLIVSICELKCSKPALRLIDLLHFGMTYADLQMQHASGCTCLHERKNAQIRILSRLSHS